MSRSVLGHRWIRTSLALALLVGLSAACTALLEVRIRHTGSERFAFLTWNLMLAWIPMFAALLAASLLYTRRPSAVLLALPVAAIWLLFLPNAPYLATDLIHLSRSPVMPLWFDATMLVMYAGTGVLIGLTSLLLLQHALSLYAGRAASWLFVVVTLLLTSFGVYLGRFERLNSWEAFSSPALVRREVWLHISDPFGYSRAIEFTVFVAALLALAYVAVFVIAAGGTRFLIRLARR
jgi:uncharacterized membrane protein